MHKTLPLTVKTETNKGNIQLLTGTLEVIAINSTSCEFHLDIGAYSYHLIYGTQINGWYLCVPNWQIGIELSRPDDSFWNRGSLLRAGVDDLTTTILVSALEATYQLTSKII